MDAHDRPVKVYNYMEYITGRDAPIKWGECNLLNDPPRKLTHSGIISIDFSSLGAHCSVPLSHIKHMSHP